MRKMSLLLISASIFFLAGCANNTATINQGLSDPHIRFENPYLHKWLKFEFVNYVQRKDGLLEFEARFVNYSSVNKTLAYKINWKNENGFVQKTLMSRWVFAEVEAKRSLVIHGISPNSKSSDFEVILQEPTKDDNLRKDSYHKRYSN